MFRRRRIAVLVGFVTLAVAILVAGQAVDRSTDDRSRTVSPVASALPAAPTGATTAIAGRPRSTATADTSPTRAADTAGVFDFATGRGPVLGSAGTVRRFRVAVERSVGRGGDFADEIDRALGDPRSWIAARQFRLQRVPRTAAAEFTVYLASARTSQRMCAEGGLDTDGFTSCRLPGQVIINEDRWQDAVPGYDAPLAVYRAYAINHEVGHQLGHGHESCPVRGRPAPVMMQQTYGLKGCVANSWPYLGGRRYAGPPAA